MAKKLKDLAEKRVEKLIVEVDYKQDEVVKIADDVYSLTIAANMTKNVSPVSLSFCMKQCFTVFVIQLCVSYYFMFDYLSLDRFQPFETKGSALRLVCSMLL